MITVAVETSCDETSCAVVSGGKVLSNAVSSSVDMHCPYGGVVPEIASRYHVDYISPVFEEALDEAGISVRDIELVCVTSGPGLPGSLLVGISFAKALAAALDVPILGVNHLTGHILSGFIGQTDIVGNLDDLKYTALVVSGGHTALYRCEGCSFEILGRTLDDAAGEAFDKAAKVMGLGYPGGPAIERAASEAGSDELIPFPRAMLSDPENLDFSFSGLKTAVLYHWRDSDKTRREAFLVSRSFQEAVVDVIIEKTRRALERTGTGILAAGGGVICNRRLREKLRALCSKNSVKAFLPEKALTGDNAAMIAFSGELLYSRGARSDLSLVAEPSLVR